MSNPSVPSDAFIVKIAYPPGVNNQRLTEVDLASATHAALDDGSFSHGDLRKVQVEVTPAALNPIDFTFAELSALLAFLPLTSAGTRSPIGTALDKLMAEHNLRYLEGRTA